MQGKMEGKGTYSYSEGKLEVNWKDNKPDGPGRFISRTNKITDVCFENGKYLSAGFSLLRTEK